MRSGMIAMTVFGNRLITKAVCLVTSLMLRFMRVAVFAAVLCLVMLGGSPTSADTAKEIRAFFIKTSPYNGSTIGPNLSDSSLEFYLTLELERIEYTDGTTSTRLPDGYVFATYVRTFDGQDRHRHCADRNRDHRGSDYTYIDPGYPGVVGGPVRRYFSRLDHRDVIAIDYEGYSYDGAGFTYWPRTNATICVWVMLFKKNLTLDNDVYNADNIFRHPYIYEVPVAENIYSFHTRTSSNIDAPTLSVLNETTPLNTDLQVLVDFLQPVREFGPEDFETQNASVRSVQVEDRGWDEPFQVIEKLGSGFRTYSDDYSATIRCSAYPCRVRVRAGSVRDPPGNRNSSPSAWLEIPGENPFDSRLIGTPAPPGVPWTMTLEIDSKVGNLRDFDFRAVNATESGLSGPVYTEDGKTRFTTTVTGNDWDYSVGVRWTAWPPGISHGRQLLKSGTTNTLVGPTDDRSPQLSINGPDTAGGPFFTEFLFREPGVQPESLRPDIVVDFGVEDISVENGDVSILDSVSSGRYVARIVPDGQGDVVVSVAADAVRDRGGNPNNAASSTIRYDATHPRVWLTQVPTAINGSVDRFCMIVNFSESIMGFDESDIIVSYGRADNAWSLGPENNSWGACIRPDRTGDISIDINSGAGAPENVSGKSIAALERPVVVRYDDIAPTVEAFQRLRPAVTPTNADELIWQLAFSEPVVGVGADNFRVTGVTGAVVTVAPVQGRDNRVFEIAVSGRNLAQYNGDVGLEFANSPTIEDGLQNALTDTTTRGGGVDDRSYTLDNIGPTVAIAADATIINEQTDFSATVTFSEPVSGFELADIIVTNGTGTALAGSDANYTVTVTPNGNGGLALDIAAGVAQDAAGNPNSAARKFAEVLTADAGPDQTVAAGADVTLDGRVSSPGIGNRNLTYRWTETSGTGVALSDPTAAQPGFTAPTLVPGDADQVLEFSLIVNDGIADSAPDTVRVTVTAPDNVVPTADAGPDQSVSAGAAVTLDASASDPGNADQSLTYSWTQSAGPAVVLSDATAAQPVFTAPTLLLGDADEVLEFSLIVNDGIADSADDTVTITVKAPVEVAPTADAGPDQTVASGAVVTLDASASDSGNAGQSLTYRWIEIRGLGVALSDATAAQPDFTAPTLVPGASDRVLTFFLIVNDGIADSAPDRVRVTVTAPDITLSTRAVNVGEDGGTATYTLVLDSQPTADVTVTPTSSDTSAATVSAPLVFTPGNWNVAQSVTVTGVDDDIDNAGDARSATISHGVAGGGYDGVVAETVAVTVGDDDSAGVTVSVAAVRVMEVAAMGVTAASDGNMARYEIVLTSAPTGDVTITPSSSDMSAATVLPQSLIFTDQNWNVAQSVTVTGVDDAIDKGPDRTATIRHAVSGGGYDSVVAGTVAVTVGDGAINTVDVPVFTSAASAQTPENRRQTGYRAAARVDPGMLSYAITGGADAALFEIDAASGLVSFRAAPDFEVPGDADADNIYVLTVTATATAADGVTTQSAAQDVEIAVAGVDEPTTGVVTITNASRAGQPAHEGDSLQADISGLTDGDGIGGFAYEWRRDGVVVPGATRATYETGAADVTPWITVAVTHTDAAGHKGQILVSDPLRIADDITNNVTVPLFSSAASAQTPENRRQTSYRAAAMVDPGTLTYAITGGVDAALFEIDAASGLVSFRAAPDFEVPGDADADNIYTLTVTATATAADGVTTQSAAQDVEITVTDVDDEIAPTVEIRGAPRVTDGAAFDLTVLFSEAVTGFDAGDVTVGHGAAFDLRGAGATYKMTITPDGTGDVTIDIGAGLAQDAAGNGNTAAQPVTVAYVGSATLTPKRMQQVADGSASAPITMQLKGVNGNDLTRSGGMVTVSADGSAQLSEVTDNNDGTYSASLTNTVVETVTVSAKLHDTSVAATAEVVFTPVPGVTVLPETGLVTTEGGGTAAFTIGLDAEPTADVTISLSSSDRSEGRVSPDNVIFGLTDWDEVKTITVTGVDDSFEDNDQRFRIITSAAASMDPSYNGIEVADVEVTNYDDDRRALRVASSRPVRSSGDTVLSTYSVRLRSQPSGDVTVMAQSNNEAVGRVASGPLTFSPENWYIAQTVTVARMPLRGSQVIARLTISASGGGYDGIRWSGVLRSLSLTGVNNIAGLNVTPRAGLVTTETGGPAELRISLTRQPRADVTVTLRSSDASEGRIAPRTLTFTAENWNKEQPVTATGVDDNVADGDQPWTITATSRAPIKDPGYTWSIPLAVAAVTNQDNDIAGITLSDRGVHVNENSGTTSYTLVLDTEPTGDVTVTPSSSDASAATVSGALTFTAQNWDQPQTVTVTGVNDAIDNPGDERSATISHGVTGGGYNAVQAADVAVTVSDDDGDDVTVDITGQPAVTNNMPFNVIVTFSEPVTGFEQSDVRVTNGTATALTGSGDRYEVTITPDGNGALAIDIAAGVAQGVAGTPNTAAPQVSVAYDAIAPTIEIEPLSSAINTTQPFEILIAATEALTGFDGTKVTVTNGDAGVPQYFDHQNGVYTYSLEITPSGGGDLTIDIAANWGMDAAGNGSQAADPVMLLYDTVAPTITAIEYATPGHLTGDQSGRIDLACDVFGTSRAIFPARAIAVAKLMSLVSVGSHRFCRPGPLTAS